MTTVDVTTTTTNPPCTADPDVTGCVLDGAGLRAKFIKFSESAWFKPQPFVPALTSGAKTLGSDQLKAYLPLHQFRAAMFDSTACSEDAACETASVKNGPASYTSTVFSTWPDSSKWTAQYVPEKSLSLSMQVHRAGYECVPADDEPGDCSTWTFSHAITTVADGAVIEHWKPPVGALVSNVTVSEFAAAAHASNRLEVRFKIAGRYMSVAGMRVGTVLLTPGLVVELTAANNYELVHEGFFGTAHFVFAPQAIADGAAVQIPRVYVVVDSDGTPELVLRLPRFQRACTFAFASSFTETKSEAELTAIPPLFSWSILGVTFTWVHLAVAVAGLLLLLTAVLVVGARRRRRQRT